MRRRFWVAYGALVVAFALLVPTLAPLSGSMESFSHDLANGAFRPFGQSARSPLHAFSGNLGGFTGSSGGNYVPGANEIPNTWVMDRDGRGGNVVIDAVFNPSLGAMKRLKAYDKLGSDGSTLEVADKRFRPYAPDPAHVRYDTAIDAKFQVQLHAGEPVPIFSPHPRAAIRTYSTSPPVPGGITFLQDGADTLFALARDDITTTLNISFMTEARYYLADLPEGASVDDYAASVRPTLPANLIEDAQVVLARAGAGDGSDLKLTLVALNAYFRSFSEGDIPPPTEVESLYLALALGGYGCCRHRAFAYMVTAQSLGIPARVVVNEAHAFVEVMLPDGAWRQFNLGGCGTYTMNNPEEHRTLFGQASDPRREANPDEDQPLQTVVTFTNITSSPERIVKGERYYVNGTVLMNGGRAVPGARVDVYLNETKDTPGRLSGAGVSDARGVYSILARVPRDLPAQAYQLVARATDPGGGQVRYLESWSDPEVNVFAPTKFLLPTLVGAVGFPANVTGRLVDVDNSPVRDVNVTWEAEGTPQARLSTDATGRFSAPVTFPTTGDKRLEFTFPGGAHYGATSLNVTIRIQNGAILLPGDAPTLARGNTSALDGRIAVSGVPLGSRDVRATIFASNDSSRVLARAGGTTSPGGAFSLSATIPNTTAPGIYPILYEVPALELNATGLVRIAIQPTLALDLPTTLSPGDDWELRATLRTDNGTTIAGGIIEILVDGNVSTSRALLTNRTGDARFAFPAHTLTPGTHTVRVTFPGDVHHAGIVMNAQVTLARPWFETVPVWTYAAVAVAFASIVLLGWALRPAGPVRRGWAAAGARRRDRWHLEVSFPDHPLGVSPVFEAGEAILLHVRMRDREGGNIVARVVADTPAGRERGRTDGKGWELRVVAPEKGDLRLVLRPAGLARLWAAPLALRVPVHDYRRAIEEGFVALRRSARLADSASPGDVVRTLGPRLSSAQQQKLREAAALFEVADYSERPVDRAFYHAFALARRDLERGLEVKVDG